MVVRPWMGVRGEVGKAEDRGEVGEAEDRGEGGKAEDRGEVGKTRAEEETYWRYHDVHHVLQSRNVTCHRQVRDMS